MMNSEKLVKLWRDFFKRFLKNYDPIIDQNLVGLQIFIFKKKNC